MTRVGQRVEAILTSGDLPPYYLPTQIVDPPLTSIEKVIAHLKKTKCEVSADYQEAGNQRFGVGSVACRRCCFVISLLQTFEEGVPL